MVGLAEGQAALLWSYKMSFMQLIYKQDAPMGLRTEYGFKLTHYPNHWNYLIFGGCAFFVRMAMP